MEIGSHKAHPTSDGQERARRFSTPQCIKALRQGSTTLRHSAEKAPERDREQMRV